MVYIAWFTVFKAFRTVIPLHTCISKEEKSKFNNLNSHLKKLGKKKKPKASRRKDLMRSRNQWPKKEKRKTVEKIRGQKWALEKAMAPHSSTFAWKIPWTEEPGRLQSMGSLESDTTERLHFHFSLSCTGGGNGNPLQYSCLENPRDGGAWWAAVYGVAQIRTWLKRLSSSSSSSSSISELFETNQ